jgi:hypothetical protein
MLPIISFDFVPGALHIGDVVLRASECLREAGIKPFGSVFSDHPQMTFSPATHATAVAVLTAAGFKFTIGPSSD